MTTRITWVAEDIQTLRPEWSIYECDVWLDMNSGHIMDRSIELGWDIISDLLAFDDA